MIEKRKPNLLGLSPATYGIASVIAACLAWASVVIILNQGPDFARNHRLLVTVAVYLLPLLGLTCGLLSMGAGISHKNWIGIVAGAIGVGMIGYEAWFLLVPYR